MSVGLFVASGIGIALLAFIWLGMSKYLERGHYYVSYFNESVQGLDVDSPVKYRGVRIGRVTKIGVAPDSKLIQVVLNIESGQSLDTDIIAQLKSVGITGTMFVELDRRKTGEPDLSPRISFPSEYPIVPSKPSDISQLLQGLSDVISHIKSIDLQGIGEKIKGTLDQVNKTMGEANIKEVSARLNSSLAGLARILERERWDRIMALVEGGAESLRSLLYKADGSLGRLDNTIERIGGLVDDNKESIMEAVEDLRMALRNANTLLEKGTILVGNTDESMADLRNHLLVVSENLQRATENLNHLMEILADHPSELLFGEPPAERKIISRDRK